VASCIGLATGAHLATPDQGLLSRLEPEPLGDLWRQGHRPELGRLNAGLQTELAHLHVVAPRPVPPRSRHALVRRLRQAAEPWVGCEQDTEAVLTADQALVLEHVHRLAGRPGDTSLVGKPSSRARQLHVG